jgi:hypothetical protein
MTEIKKIQKESDVDYALVKEKFLKRKEKKKNKTND